MVKSFGGGRATLNARQQPTVTDFLQGCYQLQKRVPRKAKGVTGRSSNIVSVLFGLRSDYRLFHLLLLLASSTVLPTDVAAVEQQKLHRIFRLPFALTAAWRRANNELVVRRIKKRHVPRCHQTYTTLTRANFGDRIIHATEIGSKTIRRELKFIEQLWK